MSEYPLPTPSELASIAAMLTRDRPAESNSDTIRKALALWLEASNELDKARATLKASDLEASAEQEAAELEKWRREQPPEGPELRRMQLKENAEGISEMMEWINSNSSHKLERFKTFTGFKKAWLEFERNFGGVFTTATVEEADRFLAWRKEKRTIENTKGTAAKRSEQKTQENMPSNKSSKTSTGQILRTKRKRGV